MPRVAHDRTQGPPEAEVPCDALVRLLLSLDGAAYVFGAENDPADPAPDETDCCLTGDSLVYTANRGPVPIAEIVPGDVAIAWESGQMVTRKILAMMSRRSQRVYRVRTRNRIVRASANHPFLALKRGQRERIGVPVAWRTEWVRADRLSRGDYLISLERAPVGAEPGLLPDGTPLDEDAAWFLGQVVGDGWVSPNGVNICALAHDKDVRARIQGFVKGRWGANCTFNESSGVVICSVAIRDVLRALSLDRKSFQKTVPRCILTAGASEQRAFLAGYAAADGHLDKRGHLSYGSSSRRLVAEVRAMHIMLGDRVSNITMTRRTKPIVIRGRVVKDAKPLHSFAVYLGSTKRQRTLLDTYGARRAVPDDSFGVERIVDISPDGEEPTYDIQVEGARNFVADGLVVHNSELLEWACARLGVRPRLPDGSWRQYAHCLDAGLAISVARALRTRGALLFRFDGDPLAGGRPRGAHVAASLGNGRTVEARSARHSVGVFSPRGGWTHAALVPGVAYPPFWRCSRGDRGEDVRALQALLGIAADGDFGPETERAARRAQALLGLAEDGRAGPALLAGLRA